MVWRNVQGLIALSLLLSSLGCGSAQRSDGGDGLLPRGRRVPALSTTDHRGRPLRLREFEGRTYLVYFYPKDGTPGCTKEACAFRDVWERFEQAGITVIGVSGDDRESHLEFAQEHALPFPLVSDEDRRWADAFGVSSFLGMMSRVSFLVDREGRVAKIYPDVDPGVHAEQVLADAKRL